MIKYKTSKWAGDEIEAIEIEKETEHSVTVKGQNRRQIKVAEYYQYHDTWEQARDFLLEKQGEKYEATRKMLNDAAAEIARINAMQPPGEATT